MSDVTQTNDQAFDALGMSDEAFAQMDPSAFEDSVEDAGDLEMEESAEEDEAAAVAEASDSEGDSEDVVDGETGEAEDTDDAATNSDTDETSDSDAEDSGDDEAPETDAEKSEQDAPEVDFKQQYETLLAPFRANGKDMQVTNVEEARQLMQMGANYNKKMAALKPSMKTLKLLEQNELLDESKLSFLIDLHKKDPDAVRKLVKDSGIDPLDMDMDMDAESGYKPKTYTVDDRELELDAVLDELQDTPTYADMLSVVSNKWDAASKQYVAQNPQVLRSISDHMASGIYERVSNAVEKERTFGRLQGMSDLEAYKQMGDSLNAQGAFDDLAPRQQSSQPVRQVVAQQRQAKTSDPHVNSKKRAASSTKAKPSAPKPDFNPLAMSDEEFERAVNENLL